jgi:anti-sigma regulatory factor (Ser/Thr protein kinase)
MKKPKGFHLKFEGKNDARQEFIRKTTNAMMKLDHDKGNFVVIFFKEIFKNIYDHADGYGEITFTERESEPDVFDFVAFDYGSKSYDFKSCVRNSRFHGDYTDHPNNGSIGLSSILDLSEMTGVTLKIDTAKGFRYEGIIDLNKI